jgi:hypothetical protein
MTYNNAWKKLKIMIIEIDNLTEKQYKYVYGYEENT